MSVTPNVLKQYIAAVCANIGAIGAGCVLGYASPAGAILTNTNSTDSSIILTHNENGWFTSICNLGALLGCPLGGFAINYFGRKGTLIYSVLPVLIGWFLIVTAQNFLMLIFGRFLTGMYCSIVTIAIPAYIGEISSPHIRGILGTILQQSSFVGILIAFALGALFNSFRWIAAVCAILPCLCSVSMLFVKESPLYLISKGKVEEAEEALKFYRGKNYEGISKEMETFKESLEESNRKKSTLSDLKQPHILKPFLMSVGLCMFQQLSGIAAVLFNLSLIFGTVGSGLSANTSSIIVGFVQIGSCFLSSLLVDKAGRKFLLVISSLLMQISLVSLGVFFFYNEHNKSLIENLSWILVASMMVYLIGFSVGFGPVPWVMLGELFLPEFKELSTSISNMVVWGSAFIMTLVFQPLQNLIHDYGCYWLFAGFCFLNLVFVVTFVYETKGKTLKEINEHFGGQKVENQVVKDSP